MGNGKTRRNAPKPVQVTSCSERALGTAPEKGAAKNRGRNRDSRSDGSGGLYRDFKRGKKTTNRKVKYAEKFVNLLFHYIKKY